MICLGYLSHLILTFGHQLSALLVASSPTLTKGVGCRVDMVTNSSQCEEKDLVGNVLDMQTVRCLTLMAKYYGCKVLLRCHSIAMIRITDMYV